MSHQEKHKKHEKDCQLAFIRLAVDFAGDIFDDLDLTPRKKRLGITNLFQDVIRQVDQYCPEIGAVPAESACLGCLITYNYDLKKATTPQQKKDCWTEYKNCFVKHCTN